MPSACRYTATKCQHAQPCRVAQETGHCSYQCRQQRLDVLHGSLLHAWDVILNVAKGTMLEEYDTEDGECAPGPSHSAPAPLVGSSAGCIAACLSSCS